MLKIPKAINRRTDNTIQRPKEKGDGRANNGLQNLTRKTKYWAIRTPLKTWGRVCGVRSLTLQVSSTNVRQNYVFYTRHICLLYSYWNIAKLAVDPNYANDNVSLYIFRACVFVIWTPPFIGDRLKHNDEMYSCIWEPSENLEFIIVVDIIGHYLPCSLMVISYVKVFTVMKARGKVGHISNVSRARNSYTSQQHSKPEMTSVQITSKINDPSRSLSKEQINDTTGLSGHHEISTVDRTMKSSTSKKQKRTDENRYNKTERKIFITLSYVIISYLICWFPFYVTWDIYAFYPDIVPPLVYTVMFWMTYINSTLNPFIYAYTNTVFRHTFLKILRCQFKWLNANHQNQYRIV